MKVILDGWPNNDDILLESISCTFIQEADCTEDRDTPQEITISTRDGGGGKFINIKTDSWSMSSEKDLDELIKYFRNLYENINCT